MAAKTDLVGDGGGKARTGGIERLITVHGPGKDLGKKRFFLQGKGILFLLGLHDEPAFSGKHLPDRTDEGRNPFDAVQDRVVLFTENDIAVFAHDLHDQLLVPQIAHFIQMFDLKEDDAFQARLPNGNDAPVLQVLAEKHTEIGGGQRAGLIFPRQIDQRERGAGGDTQAKLSRGRFVRFGQGLCAGFDGQEQLVGFRLRDLGKPPVQDRFVELGHQAGDGDAVKCHMKYRCRRRRAVILSKLFVYVLLCRNRADILE